VLTEYTAVINYARACRRSNKNIYVSLMSGNVWYRARGASRKTRRGSGAASAEEPYTGRRAGGAQYLSGFVRRADLVKAAASRRSERFAPIMKPEGF